LRRKWKDINIHFKAVDSEDGRWRELPEDYVQRQAMILSMSKLWVPLPQN
jgi:hypothetical protein